MPTSKNCCSIHYRWVYVFLLFSLTALFPAIAAKKAKKATIKPTETPIEIADEALWQMNYSKADSIYSAELHNNPCKADIHWKMARLQVSLGESFPKGNFDARMLHYRKAAEYARTSISLDSTNAKGHTWLAASLGMMAEKIGTKEKLKRGQEIKRELDTALRLNPNDATALSILSVKSRKAIIPWQKKHSENRSALIPES